MQDNTTTNTNTDTTEKPIIEIFSTPTCHFCHSAKDWFTEIGAKYEDFDVSVNMEKRKEMMEMTGQMGVPVIKIGNDVVIGFNQAKLEEILGFK